MIVLNREKIQERYALASFLFIMIFIAILTKCTVSDIIYENNILFGE